MLSKGKREKGILAALIMINIVPFFLGLPFLTLQGISYVADQYKGKTTKKVTLVETTLFLCFFPTMHAGPILKYQDVETQLYERSVTLSKFLQGVSCFVPGLARVAIIAAPLSKAADMVFTWSGMSGIYQSVPIMMGIFGLLAAGISIWQYLLGYSEMVKGIGLMVGFHYPENFNSPWSASSIEDFFKRFYISLGSWFDEYFYHPLNEERMNNDMMVLYTLLTWLLIGVFLGPDTSKFIFAGWCFIFIIYERIVDFDSFMRKKNKILRFIYVSVVMFIAVLALRSESAYHLSLYIGNLIGLRENAFSSAGTTFLFKESWPLLVIGYLTTFTFGKKKDGVGRYLYVFYFLVLVVLVVLSFMALTQNVFNPNKILDVLMWS
ncbi:MBOAT family O-acyltransferase [Aequitasia blattaphilus]|uniref:Uncharacterized protein n=1 Tax=Aequitasia blattaphilus TaxID=2949332 RepID=A0ABT1E5N0_9FIRM|nr:MBOAT family O-acyltransferase [Aequitasia blattaphilus]MCP1101058.1 hypothetical protein [Aequitasia blattaphilus]MCR8613698.1 hypothetical protein [Aequitasia blattaphilus]